MLVEDIEYDINRVDGPDGALVMKDAGWDVGGNIGYDFGAFRVEAEVSYRSATTTGYNSNTTTPGFTAAGAPITFAAGTRRNAGGRDTALSFMANALLDFGDDDGIQGFVGGGVGVARVKARTAVQRELSFINDSDTVFAYQALAGLRAPLTDRLDVSFKYRFFNADNFRVTDIGPRNFNGRFRSHSLLGGLTYNFGEPAAPPPPPPPPPPVVDAPPPPPAVVCSPGPFIVFFEWDKSDITPEAGSILDNAVTQYQSCGNAQVMLAGHADRSGSASYNVGLSQRRADATRAYLSSRGIPDGVISTQAFGESRPRVDTADGVREVQNRRVEVTYGPGSGQ